MVNEHITRICNNCYIEKNISEFYKHKTGKDGINNTCKKCIDIRSNIWKIKNKERLKDYNVNYNENHKEERKKAWKEYKQKNKEKIKIQAKEYIKNNKEKLNEYNKQYRVENKEKIAIESKKYKEKNEEHLKKYNKKYAEINKDKIKVKNKEYRKKNKSKISKRQYNYHSNRLKSDPLYKFKWIVRKMIHKSICERKRFDKKNRTQNILGCTFNDFKAYIESKFDANMNWENYGSYWWFDHIIPLNEAKTEAEVIKLNHYTNFQPLFWKDNISKGDKLNWIKN